MLHFPNMKLVGNEKIFALNRQSYGLLLEGRGIVVKDGDTLAPGRHTLRFFFTPIVHWPEVMMAYEKSERILFSADAFSSFGALNGNLFEDELDFERDWLVDARRYYGNTENTGDILENGLAQAGVKNIAVYDISSTHVSVLIGEIFRCSHLVLAAPRCLPRHAGPSA